MGKNNTGDINLWGYESPILDKALKKRDENLSLVENSQTEGIKLLLKLLTTMSQYLATTRNTEMGHRNLLQRLQKLKANNPNHAKDYQFGLDSVKAFIMTSVDWIERALCNNKQLLDYYKSYFNSTENNFVCEDSLHMDNAANVRELLEVGKIPQDINLDIYTKYIKQRSEQWHEIGKKCVISGSS